MRLIRSLGTIPVAYLTFVGLGVMSGLLGLAWPSIQAEYGRSLGSINDIYIATTLAYLTPSLLVGSLTRKLGTGRILLMGSGSVVLSMLGIAGAGSWGSLIFFCGLSGFGAGLIDSGMNLYMATYHAAREMIRLHACFGIGITIGPLVMVIVLHEKLGWRAGYVVAASIMLCVCAVILWTIRDWQNNGPGAKAGDPPALARAAFWESLRLPVVWIGLTVFVACVGVELASGQWAYTVLVHSRGFSPERGGLMVSAFWAAFTGGRIVFSFIVGRFDPQRILTAGIIGTAVGSMLFWWAPIPAVGAAGLLILGFADAPVFPLLMASTLRRVGAAHTENAVGMQMVAGGAAGALVPGIIGIIAEHHGLGTIAACIALLSAVAAGFYAISVKSAGDPAIPAVEVRSPAITDATAV